MIEMIVRLWHEGKTETQIAMLVGCHVDGVRAVLAETGLKKAA